MNIDAIKLMFAYNNWANERILTTAEKISPEQLTMKQDVSWGSLRGTLIHTMDTEWGWRVLLQHGDNVPVMNEDDFPDVASIRKRWHEEQASWEAYLDSLSDDAVNSSITYGNPDNERSRILWHCLYHVVNHGMQHRSECAVILTNFGQSPDELDFAQFMNGQEDDSTVALDDIKLIHAYHDWANDRILTMAENVTSEQLTVPQDVPWHNLRGTLLHTLDSERGWIRLLRDRKIDYFRNLQPDDFPDVATLRARYVAEKATRDAYLDSLTDANMTDAIIYTVPEGERSRVLWHCLWHMVNHGSQHRSESAMLLTNFGQSPGEIDVTAYLNERG